jgi:hypothetical protein
MLLYLLWNLALNNKIMLIKLFSWNDIKQKIKCHDKLIDKLNKGKILHFSTFKDIFPAFQTRDCAFPFLLVLKNYVASSDSTHYLRLYSSQLPSSPEVWHWTVKIQLASWKRRRSIHRVGPSTSQTIGLARKKQKN